MQTRAPFPRQELVNTCPFVCVYADEGSLAEFATAASTQIGRQYLLLERAQITPSEMLEVPDEDLVAAARNGSREAYGCLYERYARVIHGIALSKLPAADADDLVQDVFLRALPRLGDLRDAARFGAWISAIARNYANDYHRRSIPKKQLQDKNSGDAEIADEKNASDDLEARLILETVRTLPEAYRETLILRLVEGLTGPEIAERTGLSHGSVRVNLHRGMQQLREKLQSISNTRKA